ncbi:MAG TPA: transglycosylase SLT domain-containing protein [Bryobacteraceae bacterium]|nr:transglycosylase SLT domain-containing protein [Bryobacteraceae bacterium]
MSNYLAPIIPVLYSSRLRLAALACLCAASMSAQSLETLGANYRKTPTPRTRAALLRYANAHPNDKNGALALLALGATEIDERQFGDALQHLTAAAKRLPTLADYTAFLSAASQAELRQFSDTEKTLAPVWQATPASPFVAKAVTLQVNSYLQDSKPTSALELIQRHLTDFTVPQAELLLARSYEADGNREAAAAHYQKIYIDYPLSNEASDAQSALTQYPAPDTQALLARAFKLVDGGDYDRARKELTVLLPVLSGANLELARVRIGAARHLAREDKQAYEYLSSFQASTPEAEAERLYNLMECARRLDHIDEMRSILEKLSESYPQSIWRFNALLSAANYYTAHSQSDAAESVYHTCYEAFPNEPRSAQCQWRIAWTQYLRDSSGAASLLQEHLRRYPDSDRVSTALYFLGRIAESKADLGTARVYYEKIDKAFPNYYYAMLARERLALQAISGATPAADALQFLSGLQLTPRHTSESFVATATTTDRIERSHLLASAGLDDLAENELRFGAKTDGQPQILAVELAELANRRDAPDQAIRYIKHYASGYLSLSLDNAPDKFWRLAFPLPYRHSLEEYSRQQSLDPFLVAALIRQESEFNTKAVSPANARGLTQVLPSTARQLSRQLKIPRYSTKMLFTPDMNLKIGTFYLKALSNQLQGKWEETLASYNAGKSRVNSWTSSANYHEPAEFVESIPFSETRVYVQSVLRNAEVYRRLYGSKAR